MTLFESVSNIDMRWKAWSKVESTKRHVFTCAYVIGITLTACQNNYRTSSSGLMVLLISFNKPYRTSRLDPNHSPLQRRSFPRTLFHSVGPANPQRQPHPFADNTSTIRESQRSSPRRAPRRLLHPSSVGYCSSSPIRSLSPPPL